MTATQHELAIGPELLAFLDEHDLRYELIDGSIVVTPPPGFAHGDVLAGVFARLRVSAPAGLAVIADYAFRYDEPSFLVPDFTVARRQDCLETGIVVAPLLVVEVLSRSTRRRDLTLKRDIYAEAGVPSYWIVDPLEPSLTVLTLRDGLYVESARTTGSDPLTVEHPFPVTVRLQR